jgi:anhydro-N-acetylmuramic acid kinase
MSHAGRYVGLISGTSMDGIDAVLAEFAPTDELPPRLAATLSVPYSDALQQQLRRLCAGSGSLRDFGEAHVAVAEEFAAATLRLLALAGGGPATAIGSHGQTVLHTPGGRHRYSLQVGDPGRLAVRTGLPVVADFRNADIALGGQGAPLVPPFHLAAFGRAGHSRAVLNVGGIANLTLLPAASPVRAFDTGPGNTLLDAWARRQLGQPFDRDGAWAAAHAADPGLLAALLADPYFVAPPPKSTGPEHFNLDWLEARLAGLAITPEPGVVQATLAELSAASIALALKAEGGDFDELGICGGGAHNGDLLRRLRRHLPEVAITTTASWGLGPDWVEATAFAWLARERLHGRPGNLPSATGASRSIPLGGLYLPGQL